MKLFTYASYDDTSRALIFRIIELMNEQHQKEFNIAFSGGSTPAIMYELWANQYSDITPWERMRIFFVDERCVLPSSSDSNYHLIDRFLLSKVPIFPSKVFRIHAENTPDKEAVRYSDLVRSEVPIKNGIPQFDIVLLGIGSDGHTSSIFPNQTELLVSKNIYVETKQPVNGFERIALTGKPILNANHIFFFVMGTDKSTILHRILNEEMECPASYIIKHGKDVELFIDETAAEKII